jgi:hypothetical protein
MEHATSKPAAYFSCPMCHETAKINGWMDYSRAVELLWKNSEKGLLTYLLECNGCGLVIFLKLKKQIFDEQ